MVLKDLRNELSEMRKTMETMTNELHETNLAIRESLQLISITIKEMSENFSKTLESSLKLMQEMKIQMDVEETIIKSLGIEDMIPNFLRKKKK